MIWLQKTSARLDAFDARLRRWSFTHFVLFAVALALLTSVFVLSPRWWLLTAPHPGSFQWDRAFGFIAQCETPFRSDVEPALRWRLLQRHCYTLDNCHVHTVQEWTGVSGASR